MGYIARAHGQLNCRFRISGTAGRIALKFGEWLETNYLSVLHKSRVGYICTCAYPFPYLDSGWTECAELCWCVVGDPLAERFTKTKGGVHLYVRTCKHISVSREQLDALR